MSPYPGAPFRVGVIGAGTMGRGIAGAFLDAAADVVLVDINPDAAASGVARVVEAQRAHAGAGSIESGVGIDSLSGCMLVVEAVPEDPTLKAGVLVHAEAVVDHDAIVVTNTSSLSIDGLGAHLARPERFAGMHFFNPVSRSSLIEIVRGSRTAATVLARLRETAASLGKQAIEVDDSPGFATSRLGLAIGLEAIRMLESEVASAEDIDRAMVLGYRFPIGPLRLTDLVGLDVRLDIARHLEAELGERFAPPALLVAKVAAGEVGRKAGRGFFAW
ncbi:MAG TPA: 3-hydroxyacyl-CoA dehydrogenase family protein [Ilumatobacter sp.]|nr:3-hydroxyacyl-CoA dehydrogenase family protein [Ilumatobacter sp.]